MKQLERLINTAQAWQPKEGGLLATGGEDGKVFIYNVLDTIEGVPCMCVPCACAELPEEGLTQIAWGSDDQLYTGHTSGAICLTALTVPREDRFCRMIIPASFLGPEWGGSDTGRSSMMPLSGLA